MPSIVTLIGRRDAAGALLPRGAQRSAGLAAAALLLAACGSDHDALATGPLAVAPQTADVAAKLPALVEEPALLEVPTYEGSGESVHPDVVEFPQEWHGWRYWLTMTPYPRNQSSVENPSILGSQDGQRLSVPIGVVNPVVGRPGRAKDYNSDPELVYEQESDRLVLFYRFVDKKTNTIRVSTSADGSTWTRSAKAFWAPTHGAVSPSVVPNTGNGRALMWYVNTGKAGCHATSSRVVMRAAYDEPGHLADSHWAEPVNTDLVQPGYVVWHLKVRYIPSKGEYWAVYAAFPAATAATTGCETDDLFFARSTDGQHWEIFREPLVQHTERTWTARSVYRSSFLYDPVTDELRVWMSAQGGDDKWRLGLARFRYGPLLGELATRAPAAPQLAAVATLTASHHVGEAP